MVVTASKFVIREQKLDIVGETSYKIRPYIYGTLLANDRQGKDQIMSKLDKDQVIAQFTAEYKAANGKAPSIEAKGGWYSVDGGKNVRLSALQDMIAALQGGTAAEEESKAAPAPKQETKLAAKKPAKAKAKGGFSVKAFWAEQLQQSNPDARLPR